MNQNVLSESMNNGTAYRLGLIGRKIKEYDESKIGDEIDRGLILCRLLREVGFILSYEKKPPGR